MGKPRHVRCIGAALASLAIVACAGDTSLPVESPDTTASGNAVPPTSVATTTSTPQTLPPASPADGDVATLEANVASINRAQRARTAATSRFRIAEMSLLTIVEAYDELYAADLVVLDGLLAELDGELFDHLLAAARDDFVDATRTLRDETQAIADGLAARRDALDADSTYGSPAPELVSLAQDQVDAVTRWQTECFAFQAAVVGAVDTPIDCVGVDRTLDAAADDTDTDGGSARDADDLAEVAISVSCLRGNGLDTLPFDAAPYDFIANARPEQSWILQSFAIENPTDEWIQLVDYRFQFFADDGSLLATTDAPGAFPVTGTAAPGQTVHRNGFIMEDITRGLRGEELGDELIDRIFRQSVDCDVVDEIVVTIDPAELVDERMVDHVEIVGCGPDETRGRWLVDYRVTNPFDRPIRVGISTQLLSADGDRLGMAGIGDSDGRIGPGEEMLLQGWSVFYTIEDVAAVEHCDLFVVDLVVD